MVAAASTATFGELTESSSAQARGYAAQVNAGAGGADGYASEVVTVHGSGTLSVTLYSELYGANLIGDPTAGDATVRTSTSLSPSGYTDNSQVLSFSNVVGPGSTYDRVAFGTIMARDGDTLRITASLNQITGLQLLNGGLDVPGLRTVSATTQATLDYWLVLSDGATLTSESGWDYRAPAAAVPEPAAALMWLAGLAGLTALARRRRRG